MSLPQTESKYSGKCKKCEVKYEKGTVIYKINEDWWCSNQNCPGIPGSPGEKPKETSVDLEAKLDQIWDICYAKANKIMKATFNEQELIDKFQRKKQTLIIAQTFVKALCGHVD